MPSELIRITFNRHAPGSTMIVEYGEEKVRGLTPEEKKRHDALGEELLDKQDAFSQFQAANLTPEMKALLEKKQKFESLEALAKEKIISWIPIDPRQVDSILLLAGERDKFPVYVENIPQEWLLRLLSPNMNFPNASIILGGGGVVTAPSNPLESINSTQVKVNEISAILDKALPEWRHHIDIIPTGNILWVKPKKFMGDLWTPVNDAMKENYGQDVWKSKGKGSKDRDAHWEVPLS